MAKYTLTIPESNAEHILKYLNSLPGVVVEAQIENEIGIHEWHKNILDDRLKSVKNHPEKLVTEKEMISRITKHLKQTPH